MKAWMVLKGLIAWGSNERNDSLDNFERIDRLLISLKVMKVMKVKSIIATPFYERLSFYQIMTKENGRPNFPIQLKKKKTHYS